MHRTRRVSIVGAGLGGLTSAAALRQRGFDVTVYEQSPSVGEIGAGVQLAPNAMKVLRLLNLEKQFLAIAFEPERHVIRSWKSGRVISTSQMKGIYHDRFGAGYFGAHRADLFDVLLAAAGSDKVHLGARCTNARTEKDVAVLTLDDGREIESDVIIGADGIHSNVRASLFGPESPRFTGDICWRGVVPAEAVPPNTFSRDMTVWFGPNSNIVHYYVRGGELINWVASHDADDWTSESWREEASIDEVLQTYEQWNPVLRHLFLNTPKCYKWALYERPPMPTWTKGRVTLLGDAAHAMLPYLAQGANMALEDAYALGAALSRHREDIPAALGRYEALRRPRAYQVRNTVNARATANHLTSPLARLKRDLTYAWRKLVSPSEHTYQIDWIYGYDITKQIDQ